ncbi:nucleotidyl transferase AbiEii/AbiGii toxin family protein [Nonomuraea muscovyensis]|uniref:nucleotidyl transferase AbiEii/AbiGii toxin family protein n=1 Tax=Nonomuraea muscovyensis TaxID=1124761 RepID=UPI0033EDB3DC
MSPGEIPPGRAPDGWTSPGADGPLLAAVLPVACRYGLVLAGGHALALHGLADRPGEDIDLVTDPCRSAAEVAEAVWRGFLEAGLEASLGAVAPRVAGLAVREPVTGERREVVLHREAPQRPAVTWGGLRVLDVDDAVGLAMRALHDRGLAGDLAVAVRAGQTRTFRDLEALARPYHDDFALPELVMRLEFAELMPDEAFRACGLDGAGAARVRAFARAWVEDVKLRRSEDGDADYDDPDLPAVD